VLLSDVIASLEQRARKRAGGACGSWSWRRYLQVTGLIFKGPVMLVGEVSGESGAVEFLLESGASAVRVA
jgi:hypothetical protein